jgi:hypothetical protein
LPVLDVHLPLVGFFVVASTVLLIFHFYVFLQLLALAAKAKDYDALLGTYYRLRFARLASYLPADPPARHRLLSIFTKPASPCFTGRMARVVAMRTRPGLIVRPRWHQTEW